LALVGGLALLAAFYLALTSHTAVLGRRLQDMEMEQEAIVHENAYLRDQIARAASAATLMTRALAGNFVITGTVRFVPIAPNSVQGYEQLRTPP
jgi:hypothetical protein